jgi:N-hydroxyarylamine O-acetyltransferase
MLAMAQILPCAPGANRTRVAPMHAAGTDDDGLVEAYLARLGLDPASRPTGADGLAEVHAAHVERVAYETLDLFRGRPPSIDLVSSARRVAGGRGGYCFTLNGALAWLLGALGYDVRLHGGRVQSVLADRPGEGAPAVNHLALVVHGLGDGALWWADVGLGDGLHAPLPLEAGAHRQGPFDYRLQRTSSDLGTGWWLATAPGRSFGGVLIADRELALDELAEPHRVLGCTPSARYARLVTAQVHRAEHVLVLRGCVLTRTDATGTSTREIADQDAWWDLLTGTMGLTLDDVDEGERALLWRRTRVGHQAWVAATGWGT